MKNLISIIGRVGRDSELKTLSGGKTCFSFSVAVSEKYGDKEITNWFNVTKWVREGDSSKVSEYIRKGDLIGVEGKIHASSYMNGANPAASLEINCEKIYLLGSKKDEAEEPRSPVSAAQKTSANSFPPDQGSFDDLPF